MGVVVLTAAAALVARAIVKDKDAACGTGACVFPSVESLVQQESSGSAVTAKEARVSSSTMQVTEIGSLSDLNSVATGTDAVFVFFPGKDGVASNDTSTLVREAAKTIESRGTRMGLFTLKTDSPDYEQLAVQVTVPAVLAMVKGCGMSAVSGDITEAKLVQAFVAASSMSACGPSGCGPSGCE